MRSKGLRYGIGAVGVLLAVLACGETENDSNASGTDDSVVGGSSNSGSGGTDEGDGATTVNGNAVTHMGSGPASTASSAGGSPSTTTGTAMVVGVGGVVTSDTTTGSSFGGAGGAGGVSAAGGGGGAPPITECLGCETTTERFGDGCQVWACFAPGEGIQRLIDAGCEDLGTQIPRYCCPPDVELDCS